MYFSVQRIITVFLRNVRVNQPACRYYSVVLHLHTCRNISCIICVCSTCEEAQVCVMSHVTQQGITLPVVLSLLCATHCPLSSVLLHLTSFFTRPGKHYCCIALVCCWCCDSCSTHGTFCFELLLCHCCCLHVNLVSVVQFFF